MKKLFTNIVVLMSLFLFLNGIGQAAVSPVSLSVSVTQGSNAASQSFHVSNAGGGTLSYTISDDATWLSCTPTSGISTGEQDTITVNYATTGLAAGTYSATITITSSSDLVNSPQTIPVSLTVNAVPGISLSPVSLSVSADQGSNALSQSFQVKNSGGGTLSYTISDDATWLSCTPTSGTSTGEQDTITVSYATSGLAAGTYSATITITSSSSGVVDSPQTIPVSLTVNAVNAVSVPGISVSSASLATSVIKGTNAASQSFQVKNSGGGTLSYTISDNAAWLSCTPTSGTSTGEQNAIIVNYATSALAAGTYSAAITVTASGASNSPLSIPVTLTVTNYGSAGMTPWGTSNLAVSLSAYGSDNGIWSYNGTSWVHATNRVPSEMISWGTSKLAVVLADYGSGNGIWSYNGSSWVQLTTKVPTILTSWGNRNLAAVFTNYGSGNGIWSYNGSSWVQLTTKVPTIMVSLGTRNLAAVFTNYGSENGIWSYNGRSWVQLTTEVPTDMTSWGTGNLAVVFTDYGTSNGIWSYNSKSSWSKLTDWLPSSSTKLTPWGGSNLAVSYSDYGTGNGVWSYDGSSWSKISDWSAANMGSLGSLETGDLIGIFDSYSSNNGIWRYYGGSWLRITDSIPADVVSWSSNSAAILVNGYGTGKDGIWSYDGTSLSLLTNWICDN